MTDEEHAGLQALWEMNAEPRKARDEMPNIGRARLLRIRQRKDDSLEAHKSLKELDVERNAEPLRKVN
jgi:hypothetical protein